MRRLIASGLVTLALVGAIAAGSASAATTAVSVKAGEFYFKFSKGSLAKPGTVVFAVKNAGHIAHDLKIGGKKTPLIQPGRSAKLTVTFKKAGKYRYLCTVPGHAAQGMEGTFVVR